jgi:hypothetical protein
VLELHVLFNPEYIGGYDIECVCGAPMESFIQRRFIGDRTTGHVQEVGSPNVTEVRAPISEISIAATCHKCHRRARVDIELS